MEKYPAKNNNNNKKEGSGSKNRDSLEVKNSFLCMAKNSFPNGRI